MRKLLITAALCCSLPAMAGNGGDDNRFRLDGGFLYGINTGQFGYKTSDRFILGQVHNGKGFALRLSKPVWNNWVAGLYISLSSVSYDMDNLKQQLATRYSGTENFTTINIGNQGYDITQAGLEFGRSFHNTRWNIEPYARLGILKMSAPGNMTVYAKRRNENYFEKYDIGFADPENTMFFNLSAGAHVDYRLSDHLYVAGGAAYTIGAAETDMTVNKTTLYGASPATTQTLHQPISIIQCTLGLQFRLGKGKVFHRPD